ncbi:MAG TPA: head-tail adaptor protein [Herpetosiphonaceae bacterium]
MLTTSDLAWMTAACAALQPEPTAQIQAFERIDYPSGGWAEEWTTIATRSCRIDDAKQPELVDLGGGKQAVARHILVFPPDAPVLPVHQVVIGSRTFKVIRPLPHSYNVQLEVLAAELLPA